ncbi:hypothetical protein KY328_03885 [Candidatus Woesearchaeota archaeon]|nr:hypothetical protein [Candidatus Woesearchaeota archaeon]MBW3022037.1 hypothetical protein [Candidatus Woesearchaeota archaeon]
MFFHNALKKLKESKAFKDWRKDNKELFLTTGFIVIEKGKDLPWMIGYYDAKTDKMSSFLVDDKECVFEKVDSVFKKPDEKIYELDLEKVKLDLEEILDIIEKYRKEKYSHEHVIKTILVLQNLEKFGNVWNITLVTQAFNAINMKINAVDGKLLDDNWSSLISYTAG